MKTSLKSIALGTVLTLGGLLISGGTAAQANGGYGYGNGHHGGHHQHHARCGCPGYGGGYRGGYGGGYGGGYRGGYGGGFGPGGPVYRPYPPVGYGYPVPYPAYGYPGYGQPGFSLSIGRGGYGW